MKMPIKTKELRFLFFRFIFLLCFSCFVSESGGQNLSIQLSLSDGRSVAKIDAVIEKNNGGFVPSLKLQKSTDLKVWRDIHLTEIQTIEEDAFHMVFEDDSSKTSNAFYRIIINQDIPIRLTGLTQGGENVFGIAQAYQNNFKELQFLSVEEFQRRYPASHDQIVSPSKDVTQAEFYDYLNVNPVIYNKSRPESDPDPRMYDFRLTKNEKEILQEHGILITPRDFPGESVTGGFPNDKNDGRPPAQVSSESFTGIYFRIWTDDFPVIITTDSLLHVWHQTFQNMMSDLESYYLNHLLSSVLNGMHLKLKNKGAQLVGGPLEQSLLDADYYLAVARGLMPSGNITTRRVGSPIAPHFEDEQKVIDTIAAIDARKAINFNLFGRSDTGGASIVDFSQFTVRGHYTNTALLSNYFQSAMWTGTIDFRLSSAKENPTKAEEAQSLRELGTAIILTELLEESGQAENWKEFDELITHLIGVSDSMNFTELQGLLKLADAPASEDISNISQLREIQNRILSGDLGIQDIIGHPYIFPLDGKRSLPRSFTVFGQKFIMDSWAMGKMVFPNVKSQDPKNPVALSRRIPSGLDIAFGVLGNNSATPLLAERIQNNEGMPFRDGYPIQPNLASIRETVDSFQPETWHSSIYNRWLNSLRQLSTLPQNKNIPNIFKSQAWNRKILNTQLGSWTQLRHDTVLYAKQLITPPVACSYPYQYVEPYPEFWHQLTDLAFRTANVIQSSPFEGNAFIADPFTGFFHQSKLLPRHELKTYILDHLNHFGKTTQTLFNVSSKQIRGNPLDDEESKFLQNVVEITNNGYFGLLYSGWYPNLFYRSMEEIMFNKDQKHPSLERDLLITDVHTDFPDTISGDPGGIVHQAIGTPQYMIIHIDHGESHRIYLGPVFSYFETLEPLNTRKTDEEWETQFRNGEIPPQPKWIQSISAGFQP